MIIIFIQKQNFWGLIFESKIVKTKKSMPPRKRHSILPRNTYLVQTIEIFLRYFIMNKLRKFLRNCFFKFFGRKYHFYSKITRKLRENCFVEIFQGYFEMSQVRFPTEWKFSNFSWVTLSGLDLSLDPCLASNQNRAWNPMRIPVRTNGTY